MAAAQLSVLVPDAAEAEAGTLPEQAEAEAVPTLPKSSWKERMAQRAARTAVAKLAAASKAAVAGSA